MFSFLLLSPSARTSAGTEWALRVCLLDGGPGPLPRDLVTLSSPQAHHILVSTTQHPLPPLNMRSDSSRSSGSLTGKRIRAAPRRGPAGLRIAAASEKERGEAI